jgi:hypothetical protein
MALLFGFRDEAHPYLRNVMFGAYTRLVFQIVGRHFRVGFGPSPQQFAEAEDAIKTLKAEIRTAAEKHIKRPGHRSRPSSSGWCRLWRRRHEELIVVALGMIAGTVGNVCAAVSIAIDDSSWNASTVHHFVDAARKAARTGKPLWKAHRRSAASRSPPAPFLARSSTGARTGFDLRMSEVTSSPKEPTSCSRSGSPRITSSFSVGSEQCGYLHRCIGQHLAWPLILEIVQRCCCLPGLSQVIDPISGKPKKLKSARGAICQPTRSQFQLARRLNKQPLSSGLADTRSRSPRNARKLLRASWRPVPRWSKRRSDKRKHVHSAYFMLVEGGTHLSMMTVDGR